MRDHSDNPYEAPNQASPSDNPRPPSALSLFTVVFLALLLLSIGVSRYELSNIFEDFDLALPTISKIAMHFATVAATATILAAAIATSVLIRHRPTVVVSQLTLIGLGAVLAAVYLIGALLPLIRLFEELS